MASLPTDLFRHYVVMHLSAADPELIRSWIDDIFLPLVRGSGGIVGQIAPVA